MFDLWMLIGLVSLLSLLASGLCLCYAIRTDANARGASGDTWALFAFGLFPLAGPAYLLHRRRLPARTEPVGTTERRLGACGIGTGAAWATAAVVSPPDPFTMVLLALPLVVVFVPVAAFVCYEPGWRTLLS